MEDSHSGAGKRAVSDETYICGVPRILYFMQLGYHALEISKDKETRLSRSKPYICGFTGTEPDPDAVDAFLNCIEQNLLGWISQTNECEASIRSCMS